MCRKRPICGTEAGRRRPFCRLQHTFITMSNIIIIIIVIIIIKIVVIIIIDNIIIIVAVIISLSLLVRNRSFFYKCFLIITIAVVIIFIIINIIVIIISSIMMMMIKITARGGHPWSWQGASRSSQSALSIRGAETFCKSLQCYSCLQRHNCYDDD